jgi:5-methylcytosine-specific restriction protein A
MMTAGFEIGRVYNRRRDIHGEFGGQRQGGIATPQGHPLIFIFTGDSGQQYGYRDGWDEDGVYLYTGEGQQGDMEFVRGNRAIRDHAAEGKDLLLFHSLGKGRGYRFEGAFACANWEERSAPDVDGTMRKAIVFHLLSSASTAEIVETDDGGASKPKHSLDDLRDRAYQAAKMGAGGAGREAKTTYRERSKAVRDYVLARASGLCEACNQPAPFLRKDGSPYLEPHHTRRLSDGGPDHPRWVGGICPNCHREIHYGKDGPDINKRLQTELERRER